MSKHICNLYNYLLPLLIIITYSIFHPPQVTRSVHTKWSASDKHTVTPCYPMLLHVTPCYSTHRAISSRVVDSGVGESVIKRMSAVEYRVVVHGSTLARLVGQAGWDKEAM